MMYWDPELHEMVSDETETPFKLAQNPVSAETMTPTTNATALAAGIIIGDASAQARIKEKKHTYGHILSGIAFPMCSLGVLLAKIGEEGIFEGLLMFWPIWAIILLVKLESWRCGL